MGNSVIKIAIVEDEIEASNNLSTLLDEFFKNQNLMIKIDVFDNANLFLNKYAFNYELIFMDINLPGINGMEAAGKLREIDETVTLIFTTSLEQYALDGYRVNAFDYLLKPVNRYTLGLTLKRALPRLNENEKFIILNDNKRIVRNIKIADIKYIEVNNHLLKFHLVNDVIESYDSLKKYQELLKDSSFALCNRCYLVNLKYVTSIDKNDLLIQDERLIISRPKRQEFLNELNKYYSGRN